MRPLVSSLLLWAVWFATIQGGWAQGSTVLTLPQALEMAHGKSSTLKVAREQEQEAFYAWRVAAALPPLSATETGQVVGTITSVTFNGLATDYNAVFAQSSGPLGSIHWASEAALDAYHAAQANTREVQNTLDQAVKDAFFGLLSAQDQLTIAQENEALARHIYDLAQQRFKIGEGPRMDVVNALIQMESSEQTLVTTRATLRQAEATLNGVLEAPIQQATRAEGTMEGLPAIGPTLEQLLSLAEVTRGLVLGARLAVKQAEAQVRFARSQRNPALAGSFLYDESSAPNLYALQLAVQIPLVDWGSIVNQVRQNEHTVKEKEQSLDGTLVTVATAVRTAYETYQGAYTNTLVYRSHVLEPSEELLRIAEAGYRQGLLPYQQILTAQQTLRQSRLQYAQLLLGGRQALDALEAAVGTTF